MPQDSVFIVTDPDLMRGFDYKSVTGIALMIARPLDSGRALRQALGRVQRYNSSLDKRFILKALDTLDPIDKSQRLVLVKRVVNARVKNFKMISHDKRGSNMAADSENAALNDKVNILE